jgi:hypothetical protein
MTNTASVEFCGSIQRQWQWQISEAGTHLPVDILPECSEPIFCGLLWAGSKGCMGRRVNEEDAEKLAPWLRLHAV